MRLPASRRMGDISDNMMTSMIDVVFLLLIFFVCAATGQVRETLLSQNMPAGDVASVRPLVEDPDSRDRIWIFVSREAGGRVVMKLNQTEYRDFEKLREVLQSLGEVATNNPVILDIADDVPAGEMIRVYDTCRKAGFTQINFNTKRAARSVRGNQTA